MAPRYPMPLTDAQKAQAQMQAMRAYAFNEHREEALLAFEKIKDKAVDKVLEKHPDWDEAKLRRMADHYFARYSASHPQANDYYAKLHNPQARGHRSDDAIMEREMYLALGEAGQSESGPAIAWNNITTAGGLLGALGFGYAAYSWIIDSEAGLLFTAAGVAMAAVAGAWVGKSLQDAVMPEKSPAYALSKAQSPERNMAKTQGKTPENVDLGKKTEPNYGMVDVKPGSTHQANQLTMNGKNYNPAHSASRVGM